jgi:hypothetical protein
MSGQAQLVIEIRPQFSSFSVDPPAKLKCIGHQIRS